MRRPVEPGDIPAMVRLAREHFKELDGERPFDAFRVASVMQSLKLQTYVVQVADELVGYILWDWLPSLYTTENIATEVAWYVKPEYRGVGRIGLDLLDGAMGDAELAGATEFHVILPPTARGAEAVIKRKGFELVQSSFRKVL
jgi:hypothetical protein